MAPLSNDWCVWIWNNYSIVITAIPTVIGFGLKLVAIFNPNTPSDKIIDLVKQYWPAGKK